MSVVTEQRDRPRWLSGGRSSSSSRSGISLGELREVAVMIFSQLLLAGFDDERC